MIIDSHQHFWKLEWNMYKWLTPDLETLFQDFEPEHFLPNIKEHQITKTILVQAADTVKETEKLLEWYDNYDFIAGVVGWIDLESVHFRQEYEKLRQHEGFIGIRPMLQDLEDDHWILRPAVLKNLEILVKDDFPIDLLIFPRHLPIILELLDRYPDLRAVIDHLAKPAIGQNDFEPWGELIKKAASFPKVMCKLSGMITEDRQPFQNERIRPYVQHVLKVFGPEAVMFGSDWPVCLQAGSYQAVLDVLSETLPENLSWAERKAIFAENACRFYHLSFKKNRRG